MDFIRLDRADAVVTATKNLAVGMKIGDITVRDVISSGHKVATQAMEDYAPCYHLFVEKKNYQKLS